MNTPNNSNDFMEQYKAYLEDIGRIGERYESSKNFYVSLITALFTFLALAGKDKPVFALTLPFIALVAFVGAGLCGVWIAHTRSVTALFRFKFRILGEIEEKASLHPAFKKETEWLFQPELRPADLQSVKYVQIMEFNLVVASLFLLLFIALPFLKIIL